MKVPQTYKIEFSKLDIIDLKLIAETPDKLIFKETKVHYDLETNEKSKLLIYIELTKITDKDKRQIMRDKSAYNRAVENSTEITPKTDDAI